MSQRRGRGAYGPSGGAPGGQGSNAGARGALLLAVAVIIGIVILQQFDTGDVDGRVSTDITLPTDETGTTRRVTLTTVPAQTATTARLRPKGEVQVLVANGAGVRGLAGATTAQLKNLGWATLTPADTNPPLIEKTVVQFAEGYEAEARDLATALTLPPTAVSRLSSPPVNDLDGANVVVILGTDITTTATTAPAATTSTTRRP